MLVYAERPRSKKVSAFSVSLRTFHIINTIIVKLMEEFVLAMRDVFPKLLVKFEDFSTDNAYKYLDAFRNRYRAFNDDVSSRFARKVHSSYHTSHRSKALVPQCSQASSTPLVLPLLRLDSLWQTTGYYSSVQGQLELVAQSSYSRSLPSTG